MTFNWHMKIPGLFEKQHSVKMSPSISGAGFFQDTSVKISQDRP